MSSGDPHVAPYLDDVLRKVRRIWMRSFRDHEDSAISGDVGSQPYEEDAREERLLVRDGPRECKRETVLVNMAFMVGVWSSSVCSGVVHVW